VKLSLTYKDHGDAEDGPLKVGDVGTLLENDHSDKPYKVEAADGHQWWYERKALVLHWRFPPEWNVVQVKVRAGALIDQIQFVMADKQIHTWGSNGGESQPAFDLALDEHIVKIVAMQGDTLDGFCVHTSKGRESPWYGGRGGRRDNYEATADNPIIAIERASTGFCPRIASVRFLKDVRKARKFKSRKMKVSEADPEILEAFKVSVAERYRN
jgi:hypothetical protein